MSGIGWYGDLGNFLVMFIMGELYMFKGMEENFESGYCFCYFYDCEVVKVDGYFVMLDDYGIQVELVVVFCLGMMCFIYFQFEVFCIQIDLVCCIGGIFIE